jgi:hypothetical protein
LQELATANDLWLKYPVAWFDMHADASGKGCDLSGNSRRNAFFVEQQSGRFIDVSDSLPHLAAFSPAPTRGLAIADTDLDGRLDYVEARQFAAPIFHRNTSLAAENAAFLGLSPRFLVFQLGQGELDRAFTADQLPERLPRTRPAMSMHVLVRLSDGRHFELEADGGNGHSGKRSPDLHFGLGAVPAGTMADLEFSWRSHGGVVRTAHYEKVPVNHHYFVFLQP